jgi:CMP-N-acetylneuraminic acid synthetase
MSGDNLAQYIEPLKCIMIERPAHLCEDTTTHHPVILHGLVEAEKRTHEEYDYVMLLQPTNPGRTMDEVERAVRTMEQTRQDFLHCYYQDDNLCGSYLAGDIPRGPVIVKSGCVYMYSRESVYTGFPTTDKVVSMRVSKARGYNINVAEDFAIMEALMEYDRQNA